MGVFREALETCDLVDLGYHGRWYTWERENFPTNNIRKRLDMGVANPSWYNLFPNYRLTHLDSPCSDHCPILLDTKAMAISSNKAPKTKFETAWLLADYCEREVKSLWEATTHLQILEPL
ncbi:uncharacterized protein [Gossypium hirsutum]|uniref:Uncharacterized protein n=1 Tax=Gossypium hirsutum TaxID=3635 RepID=A0A1U8PAP7_GOSHI|nr:uncharacterized protein LOC107957288 [Gossypium hirsutum]